MRFVDFIDKLIDAEKITLDIPVKSRDKGISIEIDMDGQSTGDVKSALKMNFKEHIVDSFFVEDGSLRIGLDLDE